MSTSATPHEVFLSYAEADEALCQELEKHLGGLKREGLITIWHKGRIEAGQERDGELHEHLSTATIVLLLLSADFVASDACYSVEMHRAMARHAAGDAFVVPVVLRPMDDWRNMPFGKLQALPGDGKPVISWPNRDDAFADVAQGIRSVIKGGTLSAPLRSPWNLPFERNPMFTGREEVLGQIKRQLQAGQTTAIAQAQAISGLGGIGKTQVAIEFAYQHARDYQFVFWTVASSSEALNSGYVAIAELLDLPEKKEQDQTRAIEAVKRWLMNHSGWLLILDNVEDLGLVEHIPFSRQGCHLLLTTRAQATARAARIEVDSMSEDIGALFLLRRAKLLTLTALLPEANEADVEGAKAISRELGGLPLALDQAGAYIEETGCSLSDYLVLLKQRRKDLLKRRGNIPSDHPESVTVTFSLSFEKVQQKNKAAIELLSLCSFLAPDLIPLELITQGTPHLGTLLSEVSPDMFLLNQTLEILQMYSLVQRNATNNTISMHRLVQAVQRDGMDEPTQHTWMERVVLALNEVFPEGAFEVWARCVRLLPHVLVSMDWIEKESTPSLEAAHLLSNAGVYLRERGQYNDAEQLLVQALLIREQKLGERHLDTSTSLYNLGTVCWQQGKYERAESLYLHALAIREQKLGETHPDTAKSLNNLAILYSEQGKYAEAEPLYQRVLSIWEHLLEPDHPDVAYPLHGLATLYSEQGKYAEAEPLYQRAITIREKQLGSDHPDVAYPLTGLATQYYKQGKYAEAESLYQRAITIREKQLGSDHPLVAYPLNNLAILYYVQGKYAEAEPLYQYALTIWEKQLGPDHPQVAYPLTGLAALHSEQGKYAEAEPLCQRALSIWEKQLGPDHPLVAHSLNGLATLYSEQGKYAEAEPLYQRASYILEQQLGSDHPEVAHLLNGLANLYRKQGKYAEAEPLYQRALSICEQKRGEMHPARAETMHDLARLREAQENSEEARMLYTNALAIRVQALGIHHPKTTETRTCLITLLHAMGQHEQATQLAAQSEP